MSSKSQSFCLSSSRVAWSNARQASSRRVQPTNLALPLQLFGKRWRSARVLPSGLQAFVQLVKFALQGRAAILRPMLKLLDFGVEPACVPRTHLVQQGGPPPRSRVSQFFTDSLRHRDFAVLDSVQIEHAATLGVIENFARHRLTPKKKVIFRLEGAQGKAGAAQPTLVANKGNQESLYSYHCQSTETSVRWWASHGFCPVEYTLRERMADAVGIRILDVLAHAVRAGVDRFTGERIAVQHEAVVDSSKRGVVSEQIPCHEPQLSLKRSSKSLLWMRTFSTTS